MTQCAEKWEAGHHMDSEKQLCGSKVMILTSVFTSQSISQLLDGPHCSEDREMREFHYIWASKQNQAGDE